MRDGRTFSISFCVVTGADGAIGKWHRGSGKLRNLHEALPMVAPELAKRSVRGQGARGELASARRGSPRAPLGPSLSKS